MALAWLANTQILKIGRQHSRNRRKLAKIYTIVLKNIQIDEANVDSGGNLIIYAFRLKYLQLFAE